MRAYSLDSGAYDWLAATNATPEEALIADEEVGEAANRILLVDAEELLAAATERGESVLQFVRLAVRARLDAMKHRAKTISAPGDVCSRVDAIRRRQFLLASGDVIRAFLRPADAALVFGYNEGRSHAELADQRGISRVAVTRQLRRISVRLTWASSLETWSRSSQRITTDLTGWTATARRIRHGRQALDQWSLEVVLALWSNRFSRRRTAQALGMPWQYGRAPMLSSALERLWLPGAYGRDLHRLPPQEHA